MDSRCSHHIQHMESPQGDIRRLPFRYAERFKLQDAGLGDTDTIAVFNNAPLHRHYYSADFHSNEKEERESAA